MAESVAAGYTLLFFPTREIEGESVREEGIEASVSGASEGKYPAWRNQRSASFGYLLLTRCLPAPGFTCRLARYLPPPPPPVPICTLL